MRIKKRFSLLLVVFLMVGLSFAGQVTLADEKEDFEASAGFSYEIKFPENQVGEKSGALTLKMAPNQKQSVPVALKNLGETDLTLMLKINGARTNSNGLIEYGPNTLLADDSLPYDLTELASLPEEVTIPAGKEETVTLDLHMPKTAFDGIVLGGVQIMVKDQEEPASSDSSQMVVNKFARLFGVTLQMTDKDVTPDLALQKVYPGLQNYTSVINLDIANVTATKISGLTTEVEIKHRTDKGIAYDSRKNNMEMAPNSVMNYYVSLDGEEMIAGDYTAHVTVFNDTDKWEWTKDFSISATEADKFNKENVNLVQERKFDWKIVVIRAVVGLIIIVLLYLLVIKLRRKTEDETDNKRKGTR